MKNPESKLICLWSGPRNVSTALMYSFAQRRDTRVIDEPLYGHFLRVTGISHPGRDEVMSNMECDGNKVMADLLMGSDIDSHIVFLKQMAHHLVDLDMRFLNKVTNIILIRNPEKMLISLTKNLPQASLADTGLTIQWNLFSQLRSNGQSVVVIDSCELLSDPEGVLRLLCENLEIDFNIEMLNWPRGPRPEDGIWAKYWYKNVHLSETFNKNLSCEKIPSNLQDLLSECELWYEKLFKHAIKVKSSKKCT